MVHYKSFNYFIVKIEINIKNFNKDFEESG